MSRTVWFLAGAAAGVVAAIALQADGQSLASVPRLYPTPAFDRPAWLDKPTHVLDIRWVRTPGGTADTRSGVCTLFMADDHEPDLAVAEGQAQACVRAGQFAAGPARPGLLRLHWHVVDTPAQVAERMDSLYSGLPQRPMAGFYRIERDVCHVVTSRRGQPSLGHEIKHCLDGEFHATSGRWYPRSNP